MNEKVETVLNGQINAELYSSYLYLAMAAHFEEANLKGIAKWFRIQAQEELCHAMIFYNYVNDRGGRVILEAVEKPKDRWDSVLAAFQDTLEHEKLVTSMINHIADVAAELKDHATSTFIQWFITEQVEEESTASDLVARCGLVGDSRSALLMLDNELNARTFTTPEPLAGKI